MSAYLVIDIHPNDEQAMGEYTAGAGPVMARFGGRVIAFDPRPAPLEGDWTPTWMIVVEFPDKAAIESYLAAEDYRPWKAMRHRVSVGRAVAVAGVGA